MLNRLAEGDILVGDGAWGTMLLAHHAEPGTSLEKINLDYPAIIEDIAAQYLASGADCLTTNTFGASPLALERFGLEQQVQEINRRGTDLIAQVGAGQALISGAVGPTGSLLKPSGDTDPATVSDGFRRQIAALAEGGADLISIETMMDLKEARLAIEAARIEAPGLPIMASMTFDKTPNGFFTTRGVSVKEAARELCEQGADIVGSNCGHGIDQMVLIATEFKRHASVPVVIQSNAGLPTRSAAGLIYPDGPEYFSDRIAALINLGVNVIGGCCGTTFDHIRMIRRHVDRHQKGRSSGPLQGDHPLQS